MSVSFCDFEDRIEFGCETLVKGPITQQAVYVRDNILLAHVSPEVVYLKVGFQIYENKSWDSNLHYLEYYSIMFPNIEYLDLCDFQHYLTQDLLSKFEKLRYIQVSGLAQQLSDVLKWKQLDYISIDYCEDDLQITNRKSLLNTFVFPEILHINFEEYSVESLITFLVKAIQNVKNLYVKVCSQKLLVEELKKINEKVENGEIKFTPNVFNDGCIISQIFKKSIERNVNKTMELTKLT